MAAYPIPPTPKQAPNRKRVPGGRQEPKIHPRVRPGTYDAPLRPKRPSVKGTPVTPGGPLGGPKASARPKPKRIGIASKPAIGKATKMIGKVARRNP